MVSKGFQVTPSRSKFQQTDKEASTQTKADGGAKGRNDWEVGPSPGGYITADQRDDIIEEKVIV